ncbi:MAG: imidazole glycerol phosphate synthase subunit HisF [Candidatus Thermoplasmatota archaeon]|nr:imidazole glycerol phosphate synthase subunit HisF [Candidatus Thermoplasmatota archaeon]
MTDYYKRIIPCLDTHHGKLVKGVRFKSLIEIGDPVEYAELYEEQGADELVLLDIASTPEGKPTLLELVRKVASIISIPLTVGGGIRSIEDARAILDCGASKISVNTAAVKRPELIRELSDEFGTRSVVCAIDGKLVREGKWEVYISGGSEGTGIDMLEWGKQVKTLGAGEILYTGIHTDGTEEGYDVEGTRALAVFTNLPITASGGAGSLEHIFEVLSEGKASAALAASIFHHRKYTVKEAKEYLHKRGIPVRL